MKAAKWVVFGLVLAFVMAATASGQDKKEEKKAKEVSLTGKITCAKCDLGKEKKCTTVIVVKDGDKEIVYYFDAESGKKNHGAICNSGKDGVVKGKVTEKDGKKTVTVSKVEFK